MTKTFYVSTPIYYPNDIPHVGHAYTTIVADVLSRWNKIKGGDVLFVTGTDEHGKKIQSTAEEKGKKPKEFVDELIPKFKDAWKKLNIEYDRFIRTTDKDHEKVVREILQKVFDKGDIYKGEYEGLYCTGCEAYYTEKDLEDGCCPIHKKKVEKLKEETYFFKLSKYKDELLKLYEKNPNFILPKWRKKEIINRLNEGLNDLSISRTSFDWGIPLPFDEKHVCYVWFDALLNYYTATRKNEKFWPADLHIVAKDIMWFHVVIWPAILMSAGIELPKSVFVHGYWTFDKEKISKSRGKVINIDELIAITGNVDSARYFLLRETPFGDDGDFSEKALIDRHNGELVNKLGNLVSRVAGLIAPKGVPRDISNTLKGTSEMPTKGKKNGVEETENKLIKKLNEKKISELIDNYEFDKALNDIFAFIDVCNEYVQDKKPWETGDKKVLFELKESILKIAELLLPFIPESAEKIKKQFSAKNIRKGDYLFTRIE